MATQPIAPHIIAITEDDGRLDERWIPERLAAENLESDVDLVLLFENGIAGKVE